MTTEYGKKTVADLTEILKSRGLPVSGKKADLVARLNEDDNKANSQLSRLATLQGREALGEAPGEQLADRSVTTADDKPSTTAAESTEPEPAAVEDVTTAEAQVPEQAATTGLEGDASTSAETQAQPAAPAVNYALNLPTSDLDSELAKRKARAERFGTTAAPSATAEANGDAAAESTPQANSESESLKALERAKRFGTAGAAPTAISKLDEALSSEGPRGARGSKRKAEEPSLLDDPGLKRGFANRGRGGRGGKFANRQRNGGGKGPQGVTKSGNAPAYTTDKDRTAAEARKKKFATA